MGFLKKRGDEHVANIGPNRNQYFLDGDSSTALSGFLRSFGEDIDLFPLVAGGERVSLWVLAERLS